MIRGSSLTKHSGDKRFKEAADKIYASLKKVQTMDGLLPTVMDLDTGAGRSTTYTLGAFGDSYYEYLLKAWIQGGKKDEDLRRMYNAGVEGITKRLLQRSKGGLLYTAELREGRMIPEMAHLTCFIGGMLALGVMHNVNPATAVRDLTNAKSLTFESDRG